MHIIFSPNCDVVLVLEEFSRLLDREYPLLLRIRLIKGDRRRWISIDELASVRFPKNYFKVREDVGCSNVREPMYINKCLPSALNTPSCNLRK